MQTRRTPASPTRSTTRWHGSPGSSASRSSASSSRAPSRPTRSSPTRSPFEPSTRCSSSARRSSASAASSAPSASGTRGGRWRRSGARADSSQVSPSPLPARPDGEYRGEGMNGRGRGITERLARSCAAHPRRTLLAWGVAVLAALALVAVVQEAQHASGFSVAITGDHSVSNDFNTLSQRDLEHGELAFGLPAALVVLVLVFGAVVAGLVPVLLAVISILVGLGLVAL